MDFALELQKKCQIDTRRLLFLMVMIASFVSIVQFFSIPYGNVLLSLLPSGKVPLLGKSVYSDGDSSPESTISSILNHSTSSNSSGSRVVMRKTDSSDLGGKTKHENEAKENSNNFFEIGEDVEPDGEYSPKEVIDLDTDSRSRDVKSSYNGSMLEKARQPGEGSVSEQVSFDKVQKEGSGLTLERSRSADSGSIPLLPVLPPVVSSTNLTLLRKLDANMSTSVVSVNSNISSVGEQAAKTPSNDKNPEMVRSRPASSNNNSTITSDSVKKSSLEMPQKSITSISEMNLLLLQSRASSRSMVPRWSSVRDQEILAAKSQIENSPIIKKDRELYAPLFQNLSMFKRSYELMEQTLKIYIYREGENPIFHRPVQKGIYASEGWFMKLMETNKRFIVKDPTKAHLFYLAFSTRMLQITLYVPNSHSHKNLVEYLKKYVDLISTKYPFWNRTGGADHFVVGCHDWAPTETRQSGMVNCIRALCNADVSEDFAIGKDVSLPETYVQLAKDPLRNLGGRPPSQRKILAFFAGNMHGYLRPILLQYWENKDPDMRIYGRMGRGTKSKANYTRHMQNSKYCICAKGFEVNSPRVVEAIFYECVPVIISDNFVPPLFEVLNWEAFAIFVPEKDIPNLKNILLSIPEDKYRKLQMGVKKVQQHFLWHAKPVKYDIFHMILHSIWYNRVFQINPR